tara:strand:+ start:434 stop:616 length:183 start_codon:yes stop_codon:yes gene_type:complete
MICCFEIFRKYLYSEVHVYTKDLEVESPPSKHWENVWNEAMSEKVSNDEVDKSRFIKNNN